MIPEDVQKVMREPRCKDRQKKKSAFREQGGNVIAKYTADEQIAAHLGGPIEADCRNRRRW